MSEYVNILFGGNDSVLSIISSIVGILGLSVSAVSGYLYGVFRGKIASEKSKVIMARQIRENNILINEYERLIAKLKADTEEFDNLIPNDRKEMHIIYHYLINTGLKDNKKFKPDYNIVVNDTFISANQIINVGHEDADLSAENIKIGSEFLIKLSLYFGRKHIAYYKYNCGRMAIASYLLSGYMNVFYAVFEDINKNIKNKDNEKIDFKKSFHPALDYDLTEIEYFYGVMKNFEFKDGIDILLSIIVINEFFVQSLNMEVDIDRINSCNKIEDEIEIIRRMFKEENDLVNIIPNTICVFIIINEYFNGYYIDYFDFNRKDIKKVFDYHHNNPDIIIHPHYINLVRALQMSFPDDA